MINQSLKMTGDLYQNREESTGNYHFNFVRVDGNNVFLTARNISSVIKLNLKSKKASLMTFGHMKCSLIHDGVKNKKIYLFYFC